MKVTKILVPAVALCFAAGLRPALAADPAPAPALKLTKMQKEGKLPVKIKANYETIAGKALTAEQEKALVDADIEYRTALLELNAKNSAKVAATLGITVEQLKAAEAEAKKKAKEAMAAPAAAPAG